MRVPGLYRVFSKLLTVSDSTKLTLVWPDPADEALLSNGPCLDTEQIKRSQVGEGLGAVFLIFFIHAKSFQSSQLGTFHGRDSNDCVFTKPSFCFCLTNRDVYSL